MDIESNPGPAHSISSVWEGDRISGLNQDIYDIYFNSNGINGVYYRGKQASFAIETTIKFLILPSTFLTNGTTQNSGRSGETDVFRKLC